MSHTEGFVSGWVPSYGDDDDDVDINDSPYPISVPLTSPILSRTSSNDSHSHHLTSYEPAPPSPDSSVDGSHTDPSSALSPLTSSDRRAIRNRQRDPDWVPRPRNAFIIFRCEYSRKHARDSNDTSERANRSDKTLSKRAAEEWRCLPAAEREQFKILAEQEKAAHALQNPDYRFKPVRRSPPGVAASRSRSSTYRRTDRSAQVASLIMRSERGVSSVPRDDDVHERKANHPEPAAVPASSTAVVMTGRRRSASMPQPVAAQEAVIVPAKARTPVPISCMSSPGPTVADFDRFSSSEMDDSPLYTPVLPTSPSLHGLPSGFQMLTLPEHPSPLNETFECGMGVGGAQVRVSHRFTILHSIIPYLHASHQNSSAHLGATSGAYAYTDSSSDQYEHFTFADGDVYPSLEFMTSPSCADWTCCPATTTESSLAGAALPKSSNTGAVGPFGPTPIPIPFALQHTTTTTSSALHEIPAALWDTGYAGSSAAAANEAGAMFGGAAQGLTVNYAEATVPVPAAGYDMAASQVGLDEFIHAL